MTSNTLEQILKSKQIQPTAMRILILKFLKNQSMAVSLSDIEASFDQSDRVTIYRTIKTFESKGLLHSISSNNTTQYALCDQDCSIENHHDTHVHFICNNCKKTVCLTQVSIPHIVIPSDFKLQSVEVLAKGVCKECKS